MDRFTAEGLFMPVVPKRWPRYLKEFRLSTMGSFLLLIVNRGFEANVVILLPLAGAPLVVVHLDGLMDKPLFVQKLLVSKSMACSFSC